jgi:lipid-A-disaccharide synthase
MPGRVLIIAGEASGDLHGSGVVRELKRLDPSLEIVGVGGDRMRQQGMDLIYHIRELSVMGFLEVVKHLPVIRSVEKALTSLLDLKRPDVVVLIDYPGFNLRFARRAMQRGIKVIYYISPQVWAWHRSRISKMKGVVDMMLVIFPFEVDLYRVEGIKVEFVGHPLLEVLQTRLDRRGFCKRFGIDPAKNILALIPGSRPQEIRHMVPLMLKVAKNLKDEFGCEVALSIAPTLDERLFAPYLNDDGSWIRLVKHATYELMENAHLALVTSGTATLEAGCFQTPMMVVYKTSWFTYLLGRLLVRLKNIALVNIVAGKEVVPEFIQHRANVSALTQAARSLLKDESQLASMRAELSTIKTKLGSPGASQRVAQRILERIAS